MPIGTGRLRGRREPPADIEGGGASPPAEGPAADAAVELRRAPRAARIPNTFAESMVVADGKFDVSFKLVGRDCARLVWPRNRAPRRLACKGRRPNRLPLATRRCRGSPWWG